MHIQGTKKDSIEENWQRVTGFFLKTNLLKEWMKKFVALLRKKEKKEKTAINECENDDSDILLALYSVYKKQGNSFSMITG